MRAMAALGDARWCLMLEVYNPPTCVLVTYQCGGHGASAAVVVESAEWSILYAWISMIDFQIRPA